MIGALVLAAALQYQADIMTAVHNAWGDHDLTAWIAAIGETESRFEPMARSHTNAKGCYQFTTIAWVEVGRLDPRLKGFNRWDCRQSLRAAVVLLKSYRKQFYRQAACKQHQSATMAYNRGPGAVRKYQRIYGERWAANADPEGRAYLPKVLRLERGYIAAGWLGISVCG